MILFLSNTVHAELAMIPALQAHVTDLTQTLTPAQQNQLEAKLNVFEQKNGSQVVVLIVPSTQPEDIAQYSIRVVEAWKIGRTKQDDGLLILVAKNDRKLRIEVGRGLEGAVPDIYAKRIISENIAPLFKNGDMAGGLNEGVDKLIELISGENLPSPITKTPKLNMSFENSLAIFVISCMVIGVFLSSILGKLLGAGATAGIVGVIYWLIVGTIGMSLFVGVVAFAFTLFMPYLFNGSLGGGRYYRGGYGGIGSSSSNDSFSGGGGGFSGGGASGDW